MTVTALSEKKSWDKTYHERDKHKFLPKPWLYRNHFELERVFRQYLPKKDGLKLIELGCGGSLWLPYFAKNFGYEVSGIDYSEEGCQQARRNLEVAGCYGEIYCLDLLNLDQRFHQQYDILISLGVVEHFNQPEAIIKSFKKCLRDKGVIVTIVPNLQGVIGLIQGIVDRRAYRSHNRFDLNQLVNSHQDNGLSIIYKSYLGVGDLGMINLTVYSVETQHLVGKIITGWDLPLLWLYRKMDLNPQVSILSAFMIVIAAL